MVYPMETDSIKKHEQSSSFKSALAVKAALVERVLADLFANQTEIPPRLKEAMEYMALDGGKRIRAALVMWACEVVSGKAQPGCADRRRGGRDGTYLFADP